MYTYKYIGVFIYIERDVYSIYVYICREIKTKRERERNSGMVA